MDAAFVTFVVLPLQIFLLSLYIVEVFVKSATIRVICGVIFVGLCLPLVCIGGLNAGKRVPSNDQSLEQLDFLLSAGEPRVASNLLRAYEKVTERPIGGLMFASHRMWSIRMPLNQLMLELEKKPKEPKDSSEDAPHLDSESASANVSAQTSSETSMETKSSQTSPIILNANVFDQAESNHTLVAWRTVDSPKDFPYTPIVVSTYTAYGVLIGMVVLLPCWILIEFRQTRRWLRTLLSILYLTGILVLCPYVDSAVFMEQYEINRHEMHQLRLTLEQQGSQAARDWIHTHTPSKTSVE